VVKPKLHILILDDVRTDAELMAFELTEAGMAFELTYASDKASFLRAIEKFSPDIILSDYCLPNFDGYSALKIAREKYPDIPFIFVSGALGEELAIELLKKGATDYVLKNKMSRLAPAVTRALQEAEERIERKRAEDALKESENRYRSIFENTGTSTIIIDEDKKIILANKRFEQLAGLARHEIEGKKSWNEFVHPEDVSKTEMLDQNCGVPAENTTNDCEFKIVNRKGNIYHVLAGIAWIPQTKKKVLSLLDITRLKEVEKEKRDASLYARSLIEASLDPLVTINADGKIMDANQATASVMGLNTETLIGSDFSSYFTEPDKAHEAYLEVFAKGFIRDYPLAIRHISGKETNVLYNATLYQNESGEIQGILANARDITERLEAEQEILKTNEMLRTITSELVMTEERERRRIAVDLHDHIAQTLAITKLKLDVLLDQSKGGKFTKPLEDIISLINQSIGQTRSLMTDLSPSVLYELGLTEAMEWLGEQIQNQHGLRIIVKNDPKIRNIDKDIQALLFRSTRELLLNVVKHARAKEAYIILQKLPGKISVTVKDNGTGFDMDGIDRPSRQTGGFGLLSIRERLNHIGGIFEIETKPGQGTCVRLDRKSVV
jgi:PAS domain S-box-containing protein